MSNQLSNRDMAYQVIQLPKDNTYNFIFETGGETTNDAGTKKLQRNSKANLNIVRLTNVPFPPDLTAEDLIKPRNAKCGKVKVPNKFFVYRKWYTMCLTIGGRKNYQTKISGYISEQWNNEPQEVKEYYHELSIRASELFKERYGKDGIKQQTPNKIRKNMKKTEKNEEQRNKELSEIKPRIEDENLNSIDQNMFEHPHNLISCVTHSFSFPLSEPSWLQSLQ